MKKTIVNPWKWQDQFFFSQAIKVEEAKGIVFVAGQGGISAEGEVLAKGDFKTQVRQAFENIKTVLEASGATLKDVVKTNAYITDMRYLNDYIEVYSQYFKEECPTSTLVGVASLAIPGMMIEVEAIAIIK